jgi:predicted small lipoprotein YifL
VVTVHLWLLSWPGFCGLLGPLNMPPAAVQVACRCCVVCCKVWSAEAGLAMNINAAADAATATVRRKTTSAVTPRPAAGNM